MRNPKARGFTLVELLVVIGIVALLISLLMPVLNKANSAAKAVKCAAQLRELGNVFTLYANDHHLRIPIHSYQIPNGGDFMYWSNWFVGQSSAATPTYKTRPYVTSISLFVCPTQSPEAYNVGGGAARSYGMLYQTSSAGETVAGVDVSIWSNGAFQNLSRVQKPSEVTLLGDTVSDTPGSIVGLQLYYFQPTNWAGGFGGVHLRHSARANFLFYDGHVEALGKGDCDNIGIKNVLTDNPMQRLVLP